MAALLEDKEGVVIPVLEKVGVRRAATAGERKRRHREAAQGAGREPQPGMGAALTKVLDQAFKEAENFKDDYVSTEHLLLALAKAEGRAGAVGARRTWARPTTRS